MSTASGYESWPIHARRFVCVLDIMGFKDMVNNSSKEELYKTMKGIVIYLNDSQAKLKIGKPSLQLVNVLHCATYSDSIIISSLDDEDYCLEAILETISRFTLELHFRSIPFRGALACGDMTSDFFNSIFFGKPLTNAHLLQEQLSFYGVVVHGSAEERVECHIEKYDGYGIRCINYACPIKGGVVNHLTVYPEPNLVHQESHSVFSWKEETFKNYRINSSGLHRVYVDNTAIYLRFVEREIHSYWLVQ